MKKIINFKNLGWMVAIILLLILISKNVKEKQIAEKKVETVTAGVIVKQQLVEVTKIVDGDTIKVKIDDKEESIRLIGIDSPEVGETFENEATSKAKELMENKKVILTKDNSQNNKDKYDRLLRYIYLEDGTFVNKKMIEQGMAEEYTYKIPYKFQTEFKEAEKLAKEKKIGIWK